MTIVQGVVPQMLGKSGAIDLKPVVDMPGYCAEGSWSPDSKTFCTPGFCRRPRTPICTCTTWPRARRQRSLPHRYDGGPFFSPDGQFICYRSDREGNNLLQIQVSKLQMDEGFLRYSGRIRPDRRPARELGPFLSSFGRLAGLRHQPRVAPQL